MQLKNLLYLFWAGSALTLDERSYPTSQCTLHLKPSPPHGAICGKTGTVKHPATLSTTSVASSDACRDLCWKNSKCQSFSYDSSDKKCVQASKSVWDQDFHQKQSSTTWYDKNCYEQNCPTCPHSQKLCNGKCKDLNNDNHNCGACGTVCNTYKGAKCVYGNCKCSNGDYPSKCHGKCPDFSNDDKNCGTCGHTCNTNKRLHCKYGRCKCHDGTTPNFQTDENNCGKCRNICPRNSKCVWGVCKCVPTQHTRNFLPTELCHGKCPNYNTDNNNCGKCDKPCHGYSVCVNGACKGGRMAKRGPE